MKKQLLFAVTILLLVVGFSACKKQDDATKPLRSKMIGKWRVNKIDVTTAGSVTVSTAYTVEDYMDFKDSPNDDVELGLGSNRSLGTFGSTIDESKFYLDFSAKDLDCKVNILTPNQFEFIGTVVGSNPTRTETYFLTR